MQHFGMYGYEGTSLRSLLEDAGANVASANYHFGSKAKLLSAVIDRYIVQTHPYRNELLDEVKRRHESAPDMRALLEAFMRPHLEFTVGEQNEGFARFYQFVYGGDNPSLQHEIALSHCPVRRKLCGILTDWYPDISQENLLNICKFVGSVICFAPFDMVPETLSLGGLKTNVDSALSEAVTFAYGGVRAFIEQGAKASA